MSFCTKCGQPLPEHANFCPNCGTAVVHPGNVPISPDPLAQNHFWTVIRTYLLDTKLWKAAHKSILSTIFMFIGLCLVLLGIFVPMLFHSVRNEMDMAILIGINFLFWPVLLNLNDETSQK